METFRVNPDFRNCIILYITMFAHTKNVLAQKKIQQFASIFLSYDNF